MCALRAVLPARGARRTRRGFAHNQLAPFSPTHPLQVREKLANLVLFDQKTYDKLILEVPKLKLITVSVVSACEEQHGARESAPSTERRGIIEKALKSELMMSVHS